MNGSPYRGWTVVKVGGSLFDLPDLGPRLWRWLGTLAGDGALLLPGGGPTADAVRAFDRRHGLGDDTAHWLALRAMTLNAHFLAALLPGAAVVADWEGAIVVGHRGSLPVLDAYAFARGDEGSLAALPHGWEVTSDALAARVAVAGGAGRLVLLKSAARPGLDWAEAGRSGYVDAHFARVLESAGRTLRAEAVDFRGSDW